MAISQYNVISEILGVAINNMNFFITSNHQVCIQSSELRQLSHQSWRNGKLYSVIRRYKEKRRAGKRPIGDNCPMLYAMKQKDGLYVESETVEQLYEYAKNSIRQTFQNNFPFDTVIVIPSNHDICSRLAKIISKLYSVYVIDEYFVKNSHQTAIDAIKKNKDITSDIKQHIKNAINRDKNKLTIKYVNAKYRKYVPILRWNHVELPPNTKNILLIDDIFSSGSTLANAADIIKNSSPKVENISALTLFGALK